MIPREQRQEQASQEIREGMLMSSPVFGAMGGQNGGNMIQQFQQFMQQMKGKNPQEEVNKLLQSGKINQQQLNQAQQMAQQFQHMFSGIK